MAGARPAVETPPENREEQKSTPPPVRTQPTAAASRFSAADAEAARATVSAPVLDAGQYLQEDEAMGTAVARSLDDQDQRPEKKEENKKKQMVTMPGTANNGKPLRFIDAIRHGNQLNLSKCNLTDRDIPDVIALLQQHPEITTVDLSNNQIGPQGAREFAQHNETATNVNLSWNPIGPQGALDFALNNVTATTVNLRSNQIGPQGARDFAQHNKIVTAVDLGWNQIGDQGAHDFALNNTTATDIDLSYNEIGDQGAHDFALNNTTATTVDLSNNQIGDQGAHDFALNSTTATNVDLRCNQIDDEGALSFLQTDNIVSLNLYGNSISQPVLDQIEEHINQASPTDNAVTTAKPQNSNTSSHSTEEKKQEPASPSATPTHPSAITTEPVRQPNLQRFINAIRYEKELNLRKHNLTDHDILDVIALLQQHPEITTVDLSDNQIGPQGAREFAQHNETATNVNLSWNPIGPQGARDFALNNKTATTVNLNHTKIGPQGAHDFVRNNKIATTVNLSYNQIGPQGAYDFALNNNTATTVDLSENQIGPQGARDFARHNKIATTVDLSNNDIGDQGASDFSQHNTTATIVKLSNNKIGDQGASDFARHNKTTTTINLSQNQISPQGASDFAQHNKIATIVNLSINHIGDQGASDFAQHNKTATTIDLSFNQIGPQGARDFAQHNKTAKEVKLYYNKIGNQGAGDFARNNKTATAVYLNYNEIGDQGASDFALHNTTAIRVDLGNNEISDQGAGNFARYNTTATRVDLSENPITDQGALSYTKINNIFFLSLFCDQMSQPVFDAVAKHIEQNKIRASRFKNDIQVEAKTLLLRSHNLEDKNIPDVIYFLKQHPEITTVDLSYNQISDQGASDFAQHNTTATTVNLSHNQVGNQGAKDFAEKNTTAITVDLSYNHISDPGAIYFVQIRNILSLNLLGNPASDNLLIAIAIRIEKNNIQAVSWLHCSLLIASQRASHAMGPSIDKLVPMIMEFTGNSVQSKLNPSRFAKTRFFKQEIQKPAATKSDGKSEQKKEPIKTTALRFIDAVQENVLNLKNRNLEDKDIPDVIALLKQYPEIFTTVNLSFNLITDEGLKYFVQHNKTATTVYFCCNRIGNQGARDFAKNNRIATMVDLGYNRIGDQGVKDFAQYNTIATTVDFRSNRIGNQGICDFGKQNTVTTVVDFSFNEISDQGARDFVKHNKKAIKVILRYNQISVQGVRYFSTYNNLAVKFDLSSQIDDQNILLCRKAKTSTIDDKKNTTTIPNLPTIVVTISATLRKTTPLRFTYAIRQEAEFALVSRCISDEKILDLIAIFKQYPALTLVDLRDNHLGPQGVKDFAMYNTTATMVNLSFNKIGDQGASDFAKYNKVATTIALAGNRIGNQGAIDFARYNTVAKIIDFHNNQIGNVGAAPYLLRPNNILSLNLRGNNLIDEDLFGAIYQRITQNARLAANWAHCALLIANQRANNSFSNLMWYNSFAETIAQYITENPLTEIPFVEVPTTSTLNASQFVNTKFFKAEASDLSQMNQKDLKQHMQKHEGLTSRAAFFGDAVEARFAHLQYQRLERIHLLPAALTKDEIIKTLKKIMTVQEVTLWGEEEMKRNPPAPAKKA